MNNDISSDLQSRRVRLSVQGIVCSVGIFAFNEEKTIGGLLESLQQQRLKDIRIDEIIIFASGCTDGTVSVARSFAGKDPRIKILVQEKREGKSLAINLFLQKAKSDIVVILNADILLTRESLQCLLFPFLDAKVGMAGGRPVSLNRKNTFMGFANHLLWDMHHELSLKFPKLGELIAYRKMAALRFPADTVDDEGIIEAFMSQHGYALKYVPSAVCYNRGPSRVAEFIMRRRNIFAGHLQLKQRTTYRTVTLQWKKLIAALSLKLMKVAFKDVSYFFWTALVVLIELYARLLAVYDFYILKKDHSLWVPSRSAREIVHDKINRRVTSV